MSRFKVNADLHINVNTWVLAESDEEAREIAKQQILNDDCEYGDPINDPELNWVELATD